MRSTYITAGVIALLIALWLFSGQLNKEEAPPLKTLAEQNEARIAAAEDRAPTRVRAQVMQAQTRTRHVRVRGRTENKRTVDVKTELTGRIVSRPVERGDRVAAGDLLCRISIDDREAALTEAKAGLAQAKIEYEGSLELERKGFLSDTGVAQAKAALAAAEAGVARRELDLGRTRVRAPFAGVVEEVALEVGDFVSPGASCATVVDLDPMLLTGRVPEKEIARIAVGETAEGILSTGQRVRGPVSFVGTQSDPATRTYALEVAIDNADGAIRSGVTTELLIPVEEVRAHRVSPALFALDDDGNIGVRVVDSEDRVAFYPVDVVTSDVTGAWVTGLPDIATIITVGQELVVPGERVEITFEANETLPAAAPTGTSTPDVASPQADPSPQSANQAPAESLDNSVSAAF